MSIFSERLKELIEDSNLPITKLGKISGIPHSQLSNWTRYDIVPAVKSIIKVAKYFNCSVDFLIGKKDDSEARFTDNPVSFSQRLTSLIKAKNITSYRACMELHIDTAMMTDWTNKGTIPSHDNLLLLTDYFDCSADYLLGISDSK